MTSLDRSTKLFIIGAVSCLGFAVVVLSALTSDTGTAEPTGELEAWPDDPGDDSLPSAVEGVSLEPRVIGPSDGRSIDLVGAIVEVDGELVGLSSFDHEIERLTLEPSTPRWQQPRVLRRGAPADFERVLGARPLPGGHFELLLESGDLDDRALRVLDTRDGAQRRLTGFARSPVRVVALDDGFRLLTHDDEVWRVGAHFEPDGIALVERQLPEEAFRQTGMTWGRAVRAESLCEGGRCEVVLTRVNLIGEIHDLVRRHWYQEHDEHGLQWIAPGGDLAPMSGGALTIFTTFGADPAAARYALVWIDAMDPELEVTPLPIADEGGPGTYFRFQPCGDALWLIAIVHPGPTSNEAPRLQLLRVRPTVEERSRDLGEHSLGWDHLRWTCSGEGLSIVVDTRLFEAR